MNAVIKHFNHYKQEKNTQPMGTTIEPLHERIEILTSGRGWYLESGVYKEVAKGDILWHTEGQSTICKSDPLNPYHCLCVVIQLQNNRNRVHPRLTSWCDIDELNNFVQQFDEQFRKSLIPKNVFDNYIFATIEYQIAKRNSLNKQSNFPPKLKNVLNIIEQHECLEKIRLDDLAQQVGWSVTHLHETFKKQLNTTPYQFILKKKIFIASRLLLDTSEPIKRIAFMSGFSSSVSFCRCFKQHEGLTPENFRRKYG